MNKDSLMKFYWGFLFIMIDFRLQGIDVLPDIIGYILFAMGIGAFALSYENFNKAKLFNFAMIVLSIFSIYERPNQAGGVNLNNLNIFGIVISIVGTVLNLLVVYYIFMGIGDMVSEHEGLKLESVQRWKQYLYLQIAALASLLLFIIPPLAIIYIVVLFIISIVLTFVIMGYIKRCSECL